MLLLEHNADIVGQLQTFCYAMFTLAYDFFSRKRYVDPVKNNPCSDVLVFLVISNEYSVIQPIKSTVVFIRLQ